MQLTKISLMDSDKNHVPFWLLLAFEAVHCGLVCQDGTPIPMHFRRIGDQFIYASENQDLDTRDDALGFCLQAGGHQLINLQNTRGPNLNTLSNWLDQMNVDESVIGIQNFNDLECDNEGCNGVVSWDDGTPFKYDEEELGIEANRENGCFFWKANDNRIKSNRCRLKNGGFICEFICSGNWTHDVNTCGEEIVPNEFSKVGNKFYQLRYVSRTDWFDAKRECSSQPRITLPILQDPDDVEALKNLTKFLSEKEVPVGLQGPTNIACQGETCIGALKWVNDEPFQNPTDFSSVVFSQTLLSPPPEMGCKLNHQGQLTLMQNNVNNFVCEFPCNRVTTTTTTTTTTTISTTSTTISTTTTTTTSTITATTTTPITINPITTNTNDKNNPTTTFAVGTTIKVNFSRWETVELPEARVKNYKQWIAEDIKGIGCHKTCLQTCVIGISHCFASEQVYPLSNLKFCECWMTSIRRFPGLICGPQMIGCVRKPDPDNPKIKPPQGIWIDGLNTEDTGN